MKISIAQIKPLTGDIAANIEKHKVAIELACSAGADAIFFPELSLTAYEPALAAHLAISPNDTRLACFEQISNAKGISIGLGAPLKSGTGICIGMLIFQPGCAIQCYAKQQLHPDEFPYFKGGNQQVVITCGTARIAPAICYESLQAEHASQARQLGANLYLASVAKSAQGLSKARTHYPDIAIRYAMPVLMVNSVGYCDNFMAAGSSAAWTKQGQLVGQLGDTNEGLFIFDTQTEILSGYPL
jgi:predicted amidohydrolase